MASNKYHLVGVKADQYVFTIEGKSLRFPVVTSYVQASACDGLFRDVTQKMRLHELSWGEAVR